MHARPRFFGNAFRTFRLDGLRLRGLLFAPRKPRHPVLRTAIGVLGLAVLLVLVVIGVFVGTAMVVGGLLLKALARRPARAAGGADVVDAVYRGFDKPALPVSR